MATQSPADLQETINRFFPYLLEIRKRLLFVAVLFVTSAIVGFVYYEKITLWVLGFFNLTGVNVVFTSPFQFFSLAVNCGLLVATVITFPWFLYQLIVFLKPALHAKEYRLLLTSLPLAAVLFTGGFGFGLNVMRYIVTIFYQKSLELQIGNILDIELLLSKIILTSILMGLAFQFPLALTYLMHFKIVRYKAVEAARPLAYITSLIFVMFLPPTDLMSDAILVLPLVILFELTLILNRLFLKAHIF